MTNILAVWIFLLLNVATALAQEYSVDIPELQPIEGSGGLSTQEPEPKEQEGRIEKFLKILPAGSTRKGLQEYASILGYEKYGSSSVGTMNKGIASYFSKRFQDKHNSCVKDAAIKFYEGIAEKIKKNGNQVSACKSEDIENFTSFGTVIKIPDYGCVGGDRAGIVSVAGKDNYGDLEPGWVWKLALKHANGDPNSAMFLIGMCGHDDVAQGSYHFVDNSEQAQNEVYAQILKLKKDKAGRSEELQKLQKNADLNQPKILRLNYEISFLNEKIKSLDQDNGIHKTLICPAQNSGFFAPQSLGSGVDISSDTKNAIQKIQGQDGAKKIPAKYYHIYGSAFMACQLIQNGISADNALTLQKQAARIYRGMRMCESVDKILAKKENQINTDELRLKYGAKNEADLAVAIVGSIRMGKLDCALKKASALFEECSWMHKIGIPPSFAKSPDFSLTPEQIKSKLENLNAEIDAVDLYKFWYMGGSIIAGQKFLCTDVRVLGPSDLMEPTGTFFGKIAQPRGWATDRYTKASRKLATWDMDYKWTIAQHEAGAKFAGQNCQKREANEMPLKGICPQGPPDGKTSPAESVIPATKSSIATPTKATH